MSFTSMHNDYLEQGNPMLEDDPPCETCVHNKPDSSNGDYCELSGCQCLFEKKPEGVFQTQVGGDHYTRLEIQPWAAMRSWFGEQAFQDYLLMNAVKYIARNKTNKTEDIKKAIHYLQAWVESRN